MGNGVQHTHFKEFFDKRKGTSQYRDHLKYLFKTPSNGLRDYTFYDKKVKFYFEPRQPIDPQSAERYHKEG